MGRKEKQLKRSFKFDESQLDYDFQLKKKPNLWWLLLLLLPLLLLIRWEKDIKVTTLSEDTPEPHVSVAMSFRTYYAYKDGHFFVEEPYDMVQETDDNGVTVFENLGNSVFAFVFHFREPVFFVANGDCHDSIEVVKRYQFTKNVEMNLDPVKQDFRLRVIDEETRTVIPGAQLVYEYESGNRVVNETDTTNAAGEVLVKDAKVCGYMETVSVSAEGYADTTLTHLEISELLASEEARTIPLRPLKAQFSFFVKDKFTHQPIPSALAEVTLFDRGNQLSRGHSITNVDGLGRGFYDDAFVLAKVDIKASKTNYKDGELEGDYTVAQFSTLPDSLRVVYLEPEPYTESFQNVDTLTGKPISGVRNEITIDGIDGVSRKVVEISNSNGYFTIKAYAGDKITIISTLDPDYYPKTTQIASFSEGESIYMHPVMVSLAFRTIDVVNSDMFAMLLPDCDLLVTVDGQQVQPTNSGSGFFSVDNVWVTSQISIIATKDGYDRNDYSVRNASVLYLQTADQSERDIPMEEETLPCDGGNLFEENDESVRQLTNTYNLGKRPPGYFEFSFRTYEQPDRFKIYNGTEAEVKSGKAVLLKTFEGCTPNEGHAEQSFRLRYENSTYITVVCEKLDGSVEFDYTVHCPE